MAKDSKLRKKVVHQSLYVIAINQASGSKALAEKWNITLEQTKSKKKPQSRRKSMMSGFEASPEAK